MEPLLHQLKRGGQDRILRRLNALVRRCGGYAALIEAEGKYFERRREHLRYQALEGEGCPWGSGVIESTCSQFQDRFKRTGQF